MNIRQMPKIEESYLSLRKKLSWFVTLISAASLIALVACEEAAPLLSPPRSLSSPLQDLVAVTLTDGTTDTISITLPNLNEDVTVHWIIYASSANKDTMSVDVAAVKGGDSTAAASGNASYAAVDSNIGTVFTDDIEGTDSLIAGAMHDVFIVLTNSNDVDSAVIQAGDDVAAMSSETTPPMFGTIAYEDCISGACRAPLF